MFLRSSHTVRMLRYAFAVCCLAILLPCGAQQTSVPATESSVQQVSRAQFADHIRHLQEVVTACKLSKQSCRANVGPDDHVQAEGTNAAFFEHYSWLREALQAALKQKEEERSDAMAFAADHLKELAAAAEPNLVPAESDGAAERVASKAREVLQRSEFRPAAAAEPSWLDRKMAQFWMWFSTLFEDARRLGSAAPWLGKVLEWGFFLAAAVGLLLLIRRTFARQQLQIALSSGAVQFSAWEREASDWASEADVRAANREWRDAVHCLYWAAIVRLEAKRAWRHNPSRTPREYVRLLQQGSVQQTALRGLTGIFERVWYGLRDAESHDFERAKLFFAELSQPAPGLLPGTAGDR